jgi:hypothetical protein
VAVATPVTRHSSMARSPSAVMSPRVKRWVPGWYSEPAEVRNSTMAARPHRVPDSRIAAIRSWAYEHMDHIEAARAEFDTRLPAGPRDWGPVRLGRAT